jgi:putative peptide zinc metalloprotease protein
VRGIGAGFYLVYPVFYTDVTDAYRLGRWARVRTDLGGFYFHLLFSLGLLGLYGLTGQSVFLVAVLLIDAEIVRQSLPFLRFDGYWTLADLVGIPDFYTLMGRFLRSVLPRRWRRGPGLPRLQGWVTAVFALFVLLAVPALGAFMLFLLTNLPHFAGTVWHALPLNGGAFLAALRAGDGLGMAAAGTQVLVLILTGAGVLVILCSLARDVLSLAGGVRRLAWRWLSRRVRSSRAGPRAVHALVVR